MEQNEALNGQGAADLHIDQNEPHNNQSMETLLQESSGVELPQPGEIRHGVIASIGPSQILVSIGAKSEGVIAGRELESLSAEERAALTVGQTVPVYVINRRGRQRQRCALVQTRPGANDLGKRGAHALRGRSH